MENARALFEMEIVDKFAFGQHGLRTDARSAWFQYVQASGTGSTSALATASL